ncbi:putative cis-zeatin O-glucosyltransferase [Dichanthelium oligosanthes]|uniref:Glycosyltransferase n=1 Tax=Dichanthelium oligosanthes TaxID=888268 RepID=A0A1E5V4Y0_9POAL|nr:putative cis-zeatin O-glucosyltransferase [Dichanthelium oligosanthes]
MACSPQHQAPPPEPETSMGSVAVVAVPFPAQGHLNGMLHLSLQLASRGLPVHYAAPGTHVRQARARVHGWGEGVLSRVVFHKLDVPAYASPPPDPAAPSPFPTHLIPMVEAFAAGARAPVAGLLARISACSRRVVVLYDRLSSFAAPEAARIPNGEAYCLQCVAASFDAAWMDAGQRLLRARGLDAPHPAACMPREVVEYIVRTQGDGQSPAFAGVVMNTSRAIESDEFIDVVASDPEYRGKRVFAVGPMNPLLDATAPTAGGQTRHECLDWLDKQPQASVLYVSFGTTSSLTAEQVAELGAALRDSKQQFVWVLRDADRGVVHEEEAVESRHARFLSEFTEQIQGTGLVITTWAPQLEILAHGATAAFMSHCGWNSAMESLSHGKPMLAWPMHSDQPLVAELVCKYLKAGIMVRPWEQHSAVTPAEAIREAIEKAMARDEGLAVRERANALRESIRASVAEGGSSRKDLDDFIAYIAR